MNLDNFFNHGAGKKRLSDTPGVISTTETRDTSLVFRASLSTPSDGLGLYPGSSLGVLGQHSEPAVSQSSLLATLTEVLLFGIPWPQLSFGCSWAKARGDKTAQRSWSRKEFFSSTQHWHYSTFLSSQAEAKPCCYLLFSKVHFISTQIVIRHQIFKYSLQKALMLTLKR